MRVILFCGKGQSSRMVHSHLNAGYSLVGTVMEDPLPRKKLLKGRVRRLGWPQVILQLVFMKLALPWVKWGSKKRYQELVESIPTSSLSEINPLIEVTSINQLDVRAYLNDHPADVIVVNGTRIISKKLLEQIDIPIINMHVGITPKYRGVHGGYWALAKGDPENCGVTVHYIDPGIDTGNVIVQATIQPTSKDSFVTYPLLQLKAGLGCLDRAIDSIRTGTKPAVQPPQESQLYYHPTILQYLYYRWVKGVK